MRTTSGKLTFHVLHLSQRSQTNWYRSLSQFIYRPVDPQQLARLGRLGAELFIDTFGHLYSEEDLAAYLAKVYSVEGLRSDLDSDGSFGSLKKARTGLDTARWAHWGCRSIPLVGARWN